MGEPLRVLRFRELVVKRSASKARGKHLVEEMDHITAHDRYAFACQLAETVNVSEMVDETMTLERTSARPLLHHAVIVALDVDEQLWRRREQRREVEGIDADIPLRHRAGVLDERQAIFEEVNIVAIDRIRAAKPDGANLAE